MTWDNSVFDEAFDAAGMRQTVVYLTGGTPPPEFQARFDRPQEILTSEGLHVTDYTIEFTTTDAPALSIEDLLVIDGVQYRVSQVPVAQGDGYWTRAALEAVRGRP